MEVGHKRGEIMKKEELLKKKEELENQRIQLIAQVNAIIGAIQFCDSLIKEIEESEECPKDSK